MEMQLAVLLLWVLRITDGFPVSSQLSLAPSQSSPSYTLLVPVRVLGLNGPQVVLVPVSTDWSTQRNQNPTAQSEQTHTLTEPEQKQMTGQNQFVNSPFLQLPTVSPDTPAPENPLPQGQVLPVWNTIPGVVPLQPGVNGQAFIPVWAPPAGGAARGQRQVVSVAQAAVQSNSASSEEGDAQVIYILPVSSEIQNMGIMEGGQGGVDPELTPDPNPNANLHLKPDTNPNPDPKPGHLQLHNTPVPSPTLPAGVQEITDSLGKAPPDAGAGQRTQTGGATTSCNHNGGVANANVNTPLL
ncbi:uncharacterized protein si:ch211-149b19.4 isoform X1 [Ictalurus punctatus]|uniref:Uncharacterized protein si:ch211-149b19.4 isoform X1 n=1 Tax=Ictalurus punctatus TaxID=7998 RepID=A0A2D0SIL7_ICTPU|nr:uncharacterized protein si:ch211-149b19.4 isoform X1 [Ictalurus punctatus]